MAPLGILLIHAQQCLYPGTEYAGEQNGRGDNSGAFALVRLAGISTGDMVVSPSPHGSAPTNLLPRNKQN
jgi:hypothetical protein